MCKVSKKEFIEIETAIRNISDLVDLMYDYCEYNLDSEKIPALHALLPKIKIECTIITDKL